MKCRQCEGELRVVRRCRQVRLRCGDCHREYQIHEVADDLDAAIEAELARYTCIIYD